MDSTESEPEADIITEHKKRRHTSLKNSPDDIRVSYPFSDDERPKTRRVNPQRLALRLGPDLVAEMEALIVPGAKMPTFAVRKDFQERYCVDRRHIYDYFHSRGKSGYAFSYQRDTDFFQASVWLRRTNIRT
jgi:hypothetical protein